MGSSSKEKDSRSSSSKDAVKVETKFKEKKDKEKTKDDGKVKEKKDKESDKVKEKKSKEEKHKDKESKNKEDKRDKKDKGHKHSDATSPVLNAVNSKRSAADANAAPSNAKKQKADDGLAVPRRSPRISAASPKIAPAVPSLSLGAGLALDSQTPQEFRTTHQISVTGLGDGVLVPAPLTKFSQTPFAPNIRKSLEAAGFPSPTATQAQVIKSPFLPLLHYLRNPTSQRPLSLHGKIRANFFFRRTFLRVTESSRTSSFRCDQRHGTLHFCPALSLLHIHQHNVKYTLRFPHALLFFLIGVAHRSQWP